jgi:hypothetical protein
MIASNAGLDPSTAPQLCDLLWMLTTKILPELDEDQVLDIIQRRVDSLRNLSNATPDILEVDEAANRLKDEDRNEVHHEQKRKINLQAEVAQHRSWHRAKRSSVRQAAGGRNIKKVPWKGPKRLPSYEHMAQSDVKKLLPPDSLIWRVRLSSSWQARCKTLAVKSARDVAWGGSLVLLKSACDVCGAITSRIKSLTRVHAPSLTCSQKPARHHAVELLRAARRADCN